MLAGAVALLGFGLGAPASPAAAAGVADIALYEGADRTQKLVEGAKKEGTLTIYGSTPLDDINALTSAFEAKYGLKVKVWRAGPEEVLQRGVVESRAGRFEADVFQLNGPVMEALKRESILQEVKSPALADLVPQAVPAHREWVGERLNIIISAYNRNAVKAEDAPRTWDDLRDPKWKGKLAVEGDDFDWFAAVVSTLGEEKGLKLFREIMSTNGVSVRNGHTLITNLVASGEVPLALTVFSYKAEQLNRAGAPVQPLTMAPAVARVNGVGVARRAPHPHAALLFYDFMLTDGQEILLKRDFWPTNRKVKDLPADYPLKIVDSAQMLDEGEKWTRLFKEVVLSQARK